jgi:hypothetical protein
MAGRSRSIIFSGRGSCSLRKATGGNEETSAHRMHTHADLGHLSVSCPTLVLFAQSFLQIIVSQIGPENTLCRPEKVKSPPTTPNWRPAPCHYVYQGHICQIQHHFRNSLHCSMVARSISIPYRNSRNVPQYAERLQPLPKTTPSGHHAAQRAAGP